MSMLRFPQAARCQQCNGAGGWNLAKLSEYAFRFGTYWHRCGVCKGTGKQPKQFRPKLP